MRHFGFGIEHGVVHIHIHNLCTCLHLLNCYRQCLIIAFLIDKTQELPTSCYIASLSHIHKHSLGSDFGHFEPRKLHHFLNFWYLARCILFCHICDSFYVIGSRSTTTTNDVHHTFFKHHAHMLSHCVGSFVIFTHFVRQTSIRISTHSASCY